MPDLNSPATGLTEINERVGKYRWTICGLLFFATTINYLDRSVISLLKPDLEKIFNWTESDYADIVIMFQYDRRGFESCYIK